MFILKELSAAGGEGGVWFSNGSPSVLACLWSDSQPAHLTDTVTIKM